MKTLLMAVVTATAALAAPLASAQKIGVTMSQFDDNFLTILRNSIADSARKAGVSVQIEDAGGDVGKQLSQIQNMIAQKVDAVIVNTVDTDATPKMTRLLTEVRIPLVYVNRKPVDFEKLPPGMAVVASDETVSGKLQAEQVCKLLDGKGSIRVLMGDLSNEAARSRTKAVEDVLAGKECSGIKIADKREGKWDRTRGQDITTNWLSSGLTFDAIVSNNQEMAAPAHRCRHRCHARCAGVDEGWRPEGLGLPERHRAGRRRDRCGDQTGQEAAPGALRQHTVRVGHAREHGPVRRQKLIRPQPPTGPPPSCPPIGPSARSTNQPNGKPALRPASPVRTPEETHRMKPLLMAVAMAAALAAPLASAQKIGVTMATFDDIFLNILRNSIADAARKAGASVQIEDAGSDVGKQLSQIQNMIAQKVDAVIVNAVDTDATPKMTRLLTEARIPLVYVNRKPADFEKLPASVVMVASDEMAAGK